MIFSKVYMLVVMFFILNLTGIRVPSVLFFAERSEGNIDNITLIMG
jgi:hypothetical protein